MLRLIPRLFHPRLSPSPQVLNPSLRPLSATPRPSSSYRRFGDPVPPRRSAYPTPIPYSPPRKPLFNNFRRPPPIVFLVLGGGGVYYLAHLEQVPETGRWRFMDVSPAMERQLGEEGFGQTMAEYRGKLLPDRHPTARYVQSVVKRITEASGLEAGPGGWETHVVAEGETRNAFVLPGGKIFVFTGILPVCATEDGLAIVLGHEIAHQVARHSAERMSSLKVLFALSLLLESTGLDVGLSRLLLNLLLTLPNSRKSESEADYIGLKLATAACFDPRAATGLWERMGAAEGGGGNVDFLSTHPASGKRVEKVTKWAEEMMEGRPGECGPLERQVGEFRARAGATW